MSGQIDIPEGKGRGHWQRTIVAAFTEAPRWAVIIWCPDCGKPLGLYEHRIADDGQVSPSVGHPAEYPPCPWHVTPRLIGWAALPPPPVLPQNVCENCGAKNASLSGWGTWSGGRGLICPKCVTERMAHP